MAEHPTYCELLAEIYEQNAANRYVEDRFYEDEDLPGFDYDKYEEQEIEEGVLEDKEQEMGNPSPLRILQPKLDKITAASQQ